MSTNDPEYEAHLLAQKAVELSKGEKERGVSMGLAAIATALIAVSKTQARQVAAIERLVAEIERRPLRA